MSEITEPIVASSPIANADEPLDRLAIASFAEEFGNPKLGPICVVIPAYEEEVTVGAVLDGIPAEICGVATAKLVMIDGGTDQTAAIARQHGAFVCEFKENRGQGVALRLGYRLALEHAAQYVVIVDADGQWDPTEMQALVEPLLAGDADMVQGSRRLGWAANDDKFRALGVLFFARLIRFLTHSSITDSSTGFRAFRAEVLTRLSFTQVQYQASEVLIELLSFGYRVVEVPCTMRARTAGESKKGNNIPYAFRYARVILRTWWRVRRNFTAV